MEKDILKEVIEVEKEVHEKIQIEKRISQEWLEKIKKDTEPEVLKEEENLKGSFNKAVKDAKLNAEKKAAAILEEANIKAERFEELSDGTLKKIILKHIKRILPDK
jgi:hypothetical protein